MKSNGIDIEKVNAILVPGGAGTLVALSGSNKITRKALEARFGKSAPCPGRPGRHYIVTIDEAKAVLNEGFYSSGPRFVVNVAGYAGNVAEARQRLSGLYTYDETKEEG